MGDDQDQPVMLFYNSDGNRVDKGSPDVNSQYLSDDPNRPDSPEDQHDALTGVVVRKGTGKGKSQPESQPEAGSQLSVAPTGSPDKPEDAAGTVPAPDATADATAGAPKRLTPAEAAAAARAAKAAKAPPATKAVTESDNK